MLIKGPALAHFHTRMSYWDHIKQAYKAVSIYDGADVFLREFRRLRVHVGDLLAAHWMLSEISNGGVHQFFFNPTGVLAPEAAQAFDRMGLVEVAALLRAAMAGFGDGYPREMEQRESFLARHGPEVFEPLERKLYEVGAADLRLIYDVMDAYAARNASEPSASQNGVPTSPSGGSGGTEDRHR